MPEIVVTAQRRSETGKNANRRLRSNGLVPGILYGNHKESIQVSVSPREIGNILRSSSGENTLFDLELEGTRHKVILKEHQAEPIKGGMLHVDLYEVALDKPLELMVHIELTGTPVGVKTQGGVLDFVTRELLIECLPMDIPEKITVDVSALELNKHVRVSEITVPQRVKVLTEADLVIAHVVVPRAEVTATPAEAEAAEAATTAEPEVIKKGKTAEPEEAAATKEKK